MAHIRRRPAWTPRHLASVWMTTSSDRPTIAPLPHQGVKPLPGETKRGLVLRRHPVHRSSADAEFPEFRVAALHFDDDVAVEDDLPWQLDLQAVRGHVRILLGRTAGPIPSAWMRAEVSVLGHSFEPR